MKTLRNPTIFLLSFSLLGALAIAEYNFTGRMTKKCGEGSNILDFTQLRDKDRDMCVKFENNGQCDITMQVHFRERGRADIAEVKLKPGDSRIREFRGVFRIDANCQDDPQDEPCILDYQIIYSAPPGK